MSSVLLVGKGAPDRGGIPTFLETLRGGPLAHEHDVRFLNVAHAGVPEGGRATVGNVRRTLQDAVAVWRAAPGPGGGGHPPPPPPPGPPPPAAAAATWCTSTPPSPRRSPSCARPCSRSPDGHGAARWSSTPTAATSRSG